MNYTITVGKVRGGFSETYREFVTEEEARAYYSDNSNFNLLVNDSDLYEIELNEVVNNFEDDYGIENLESKILGKNEGKIVEYKHTLNDDYFPII